MGRCDCLDLSLSRQSVLLWFVWVATSIFQILPSSPTIALKCLRTHPRSLFRIDADVRVAEGTRGNLSAYDVHVPRHVHERYNQCRYTGFLKGGFDGLVIFSNHVPGVESRCFQRRDGVVAANTGKSLLPITERSQTARTKKVPLAICLTYSII